MGSILPLNVPKFRWGRAWTCVLIALSCLQATLGEPKAALSQWVHEQWQTDRGLPQNSVFCLAQDAHGFLWFGTENGLVRYDGAELRIFNQQTPPALRHNFVSSLLAAQDGSLWAGTRTGGLVHYCDGAFDEPVPELSDEKVFALAQTPDSAIWLGTSTGLIRLLGGTIATWNTREGLPSESVTALEASRDGSLWVGCANGDICRWREGKIVSYPQPRASVESSVTALAEDPRTGELWIAFDGNGLLRLRGTTFTRIELLEREIENLHALHIDTEGAVWVGTQYDGIVRYKDGQSTRFDTQDGLGTDYVIALFEDREGSVWAGTLFGGLHRLYQGPVVTFGKREGLEPEHVTCLVEIEPGTLWLGTRNDGVVQRKNGKFQPIATQGLSREIRAMLRPREGGAWLGGKDGGLLYVHGETQDLLTMADGLVANDVSALHQMRSGEIWAGSQHAGITVLDPVTHQVLRTLTDDCLRMHVRCFAEGKDGTLWIGTQNGMVRSRNGVFQPHYLPPYSDASIRSLFFDDEDSLWIGTRDNGLLRLNKLGLFSFDARSGLVHTRIYQLLPIGRDVWIAGNRGIEYARLDELQAVASGGKRRVETRLLTERDGLRTVECSSDTSPSALAASDGTLWFGTRRGLASLRPQSITPPPKAPRVVITRVRLDRTEVLPSSFTRVPPGTHRVQFSYTQPSLRHGADATYRYKLDEDKLWINAGKDREAVFNNLKPGHYTFRVASVTPAGHRSWEETTLGFTVEPRFYQTAWFSLAALLVSAGSVRGVYRWRVAGIQRRNATLQQLVRLRTHELEEEIVQRKRAEEQQIALNADLENRVVERTAELRGAYGNLQEELRERARVEQELAASEARLRRVVDSGMVGILFWHTDGRITEANDTFLRMVGYSREEMARGEILWSHLTPPEYARLDAEGLEEIRKTGVCTTFEKEYIRKDGSRFPVLIGGASLEREHGVCFVLDISERKASEEEVRELAHSLETRVQERTLELARINEQLATEVLERKRVAVALSSFSQLGQKLHAAHTEKEAANIIALAAKSLIPHDLCSIELYGPDFQLYPVIRTGTNPHCEILKKIESSISVPVRNGSRVIGVIGLQSSTADSFNIADANTLQALADYCGGALDRIHAEEARRETERRFAAFMANAPALAWMKDAKLRYIFSNPVFQEFLGLSPLQIETKCDADLWPEATASQICANDRRVFDTDQTLETQETLTRADGETRTLLTLRFPFKTTGGEQFVAGMAVDITEQKRAEDALHRLPQSILEAQEQERRRLARELHDSVNQAIASAKFRIQTAENQILRGDPKWQESCSKSKQMLDLVLQQVRRLSHNLRPGELDDLGLLPAARTAFREFEARTGITVHFTATGLEERLDPALESTLYRIMQEALTNIEKHSAATVVEVELARNDSGVTLDVADNGVGFDTGRKKEGRSGLGLLHMRERASLIGAEFTCHAAPGRGVRLVVEIKKQTTGTI